jgi:dTDP-4-amino-4,6-dideoxygalactose transaminase
VNRPAPVATRKRLTVPLLDLKSQYATLQAAVLPVIQEICTSQQFILGRHVSALEEAVAAYSRAEHAVGVSSGTDALLLALMALDIKAGDEVITAPFTFFATAGTIARTGARPVFCDIEPDTFNISPTAVRQFLQTHCERRADGRWINRRTGGVVRALMPVHLYGQSADMAALLSIAREYVLDVIEDAAQAIGADDAAGRRAGSVGTVGCLSFFPTKNLGAFGDAGMCVCQNAELAERMRVLRVHGGKPKYYHSLIGGNFRLDELQAAVLEIKLTHLDTWTEARQCNALYYDRAFFRAGLTSKVITPKCMPGFRHTYNQYVIRVPQRDALRGYLADCGVGTEVYYPVPLHQQQCFAYLGHAANDFPQSQRAAAEVLALPIYPELSTDQLQYVVDCVADFYG